MKSGLFTTLFNRNVRGVLPASTWKRQPSLGSILKILLPIWRDNNNLVLFEVPQSNACITNHWSCHQLERLASRPHRMDPAHGPILLLYYSIRPHVPNTTRQKLLLLGWDVLFQPLANSGLAPPTIICSCPRSTISETRPSSTKRTLTSGWRISLPPGPTPVIVMAFKISPEKQPKVIHCARD